MPGLTLPFDSGVAGGSVPTSVPTGVVIRYIDSGQVLNWSSGDPTDDLNMRIDLDQVFPGVGTEALRTQFYDNYVQTSPLASAFYALKQLVENNLSGASKTEFESYTNAVQSLVPPPTPTELRWQKADNGSVITWSLDVQASNLPFTEAQLLAKSEEQIKKIEDVCNVTFQYLPGGVSSDIRIFFENVDGPGGTLGFVFQPSTGTNMAACGVCGPVHMDQDEGFSLTDYGNVLLHELGHSVGLAHTSDIGVPSGSNVMDPFYSFGSAEFQWGPSDIEELRKRYVLV